MLNFGSVNRLNINQSFALAQPIFVGNVNKETEALGHCRGFAGFLCERKWAERLRIKASKGTTWSKSSSSSSFSGNKNESTKQQLQNKYEEFLHISKTGILSKLIIFFHDGLSLWISATNPSPSPNDPSSGATLSWKTRLASGEVSWNRKTSPNLVATFVVKNGRDRTFVGLVLSYLKKCMECCICNVLFMFMLCYFTKFKFIQLVDIFVLYWRTTTSQDRKMLHPGSPAGLEKNTGQKVNLHTTSWWIKTKST